MQGNYYYRRLREELERIPGVVFKRIQYGTDRIYWHGIYIAECPRELPPRYAEIEVEDPRLMKQSYYEEYEDKFKLSRTMKNFTEGYYDTLNNVKMSIWNYSNNPDLLKETEESYRQFIVK